MKRYCMFLLLAAALFSCRKETPASEENTNPAEGNRVEFFATIDDDSDATENPESKVYLDTDGLSLLWNKNDVIGIGALDATGKEATLLQYKPQTIGKSAVLVPVGDSVQDLGYGFVAVFPYSADTKFTDGKFETVNVHPNQKARIGSVQSAANVMVAKSDNTTLAFKNACGLIRFTLTRNDIKAVKISIGSGRMSGTLKLYWNASNALTRDNVSTKLFINLANDDNTTCLTPGTYNLVCHPNNMANGFSLEYTRKDGKTATITATKAAKVLQNKILNIGTPDTALKFDDED